MIINNQFYNFKPQFWAVGSLVVRASDSRPEGLGSMPDATKHPPSTHEFTCRNCGGGDRGRVAIYRPFGELRRAKIVLSPVWCSRPTTGVPSYAKDEEKIDIFYQNLIQNQNRKA
ncbi:hypothetical protein TNCV_4862221 [Trichonephila clavipes]|nr:hypothetical protein TNCV_4862221 [Trichonephila clavipes]